MGTLASAAPGCTQVQHFLIRNIYRWMSAWYTWRTLTHMDTGIPFRLPRTGALRVVHGYLERRWEGLGIGKTWSPLELDVFCVKEYSSHGYAWTVLLTALRTEHRSSPLTGIETAIRVLWCLWRMSIRLERLMGRWRGRSKEQKCLCMWLDSFSTQLKWLTSLIPTPNSMTQPTKQTSQCLVWTPRARETVAALYLILGTFDFPSSPLPEMLFYACVVLSKKYSILPQGQFSVCWQLT